MADLQQKLSDEPDSFQSAVEDAQAPITKNYTDLVSALQNGNSLTTDQQDILHLAVTTTHQQLERFACCPRLQPPFLISASGHWTQDSRLTTEYLKQLVSTYVYDDQEVQKPFWQRIFGIRKLLGVTPSLPGVQIQSMGRGRFWTGHQSVNPTPDANDTASPPQHSTAGRPTLKRQNAFKLNEQQSQTLTQQLGLSSHAHSGHDLLAEDASEATDEASQEADHEYSSHRSGSSVDLGNIIAGAKALSQGQVLQEVGPEDRAVRGQPDPHRPFNATLAYANITRCNTRRWLALHAGGVLLVISCLSTFSCIGPRRHLSFAQIAVMHEWLQ